MIKKLLINNTKEYQCDYYDKSPAEFLIVRVDCDDIKQIRQDFKDIESITILDENDTEVYTTTQYTALSDINALLDFYVDKNGDTRDGFQLTLREPDLKEQIKQLEQIVNPVYDESTMNLDELKSYRIGLSKQELQEFLANNPLVSSCHAGKEGTYSVTKEKQDSLISSYMSYQIRKQMNPDAVITWNETGKESEVWTEEEIIQLIDEITDYVYPRVSLQRRYEVEITECTTKEAVLQIEFDYINLI